MPKATNHKIFFFRSHFSFWCVVLSVFFPAAKLICQRRNVYCGCAHCHFNTNFSPFFSFDSRHLQFPFLFCSSFFSELREKRDSILISFFAFTKLALILHVPKEEIAPKGIACFKLLVAAVCALHDNIQHWFMFPCATTNFSLLSEKKKLKKFKISFRSSRFSLCQMQKTYPRNVVLSEFLVLVAEMSIIFSTTFSTFA